ncbi:molybdate ABC transporter permease subunit [Brotomerdimonas butyrica]|uniref:molybdate ABC transporter permease subunit n=1 Tax=Brotomerdimonas butyrica TaxID=2981721 RepID=UPI0021D11332|nr:molybdate ABC transporter permease subunit [Brotomerdimonas butyrica]MCU6755117.1 molybdate ABC transporter permease subunit [Brotomerdimonas butyrica]
MMFEPIFLSIRVALLATVIAFFLGVLFAYLLTKKKVPGKNIWETILILPMILPPSIVGYLLLKIFGKRGPIGAFLLDTFGIQIVFTWIACVIAATVVALPLMYQNAKGAFQSVDPSYELAAKTLGSSSFKVFRTVTFPLSGPGIVSGIVLTFARALGEFGATLMLAGNIPGKTQTIPTAIYYAVVVGKDEKASMLVLIMVLFSFALVFGLNMWLKRREKRGGLVR